MGSPQPPSPRTLTLIHQCGSIFDAPDQTVLLHACNTQGKWGSGIAAAFKNLYPSAFKVYQSHCLSSTVQTGTSLLILPDPKSKSSKHYIACLFTSAKYGRQKDAPEEILGNTSRAVEHLLGQVNEAERNGAVVGALRMCRINSGKFGVVWAKTEGVLREVLVEDGYRSMIEVWDREAEAGEPGR